MRAKEMVDAGVVDQGDAIDAIYKGCVNAGALEEIGPDAIQRMLAHAFAATSSQAPDDPRRWPQLSPPAARGLAGELARVATEHSEADPVVDGAHEHRRSDGPLPLYRCRRV